MEEVRLVEMEVESLVRRLRNATLVEALRKSLDGRGRRWQNF